MGKPITALAGALLLMGILILIGACAPAAAPPTPTPAPVAKPAAAVATAAPPTAAPPTAAPATPTPRKVEKVVMPFQTTGFTDFCIVVAKKKGFYQSEALEVETPIIASDIAVKAMIGGTDIDYVTSWGSSVRAAVTGVPIKAIMAQLDKTPHILVARADIKTVSDLRGKKIGVASVGGTVEVLARLALKKAGVDPDKEVNFVVISDSATRLVSIRTGVIDGSVMDPAFAIAAEKEGLTLLVRFKDVVDIVMSGISTSDKKIKENPDQVLRVVRASVKGCQYLRDPKNRVEIVKLMMDELKLAQDVADRTYDLSIDTVSEDGSWRDSAVQTDIDAARERANVKEAVPLSQVVDATFVRKLKETR
ncbi:MAG: ABC transporter substrate-binding protein [Dehalococcoidia bacterium]|nr:ABC transporter substrate-binding protein [Dehalococcoidia bacterium]